MSDLSAAAAAALGIPEAIVMRSAAARATETGMTVDEVLTAWAAGGSIDAPIPEAPEEADGPPAEATPPSVDETPTGPPAAQGDNPAKRNLQRVAGSAPPGGEMGQPATGRQHRPTGVCLAETVRARSRNR